MLQTEITTETLTLEPTNSRKLSNTPKEIYISPDATHSIRLGNGGAGPSGIFRALAKDYQQAYRSNASTIAWYQNISPLTLEALKDGSIDVALTYERDQEEAAIAKGWAVGPSELIFNDHFVLAGPKHNPAGVARDDSPQDAFRKLLKLAQSHTHKQVFHSRNDDSATNLKERSIWRDIGVELDQDLLPPWYAAHHIFPADALRQADREGLYILIDHGTFGMLRSELKNNELFVRGGELLRNPCHALLSPEADEGVRRFLEYIKSARGQEVIARFGKEEFGEALYTPAAVLDF